ncbi:MAG: hypothetical protein IJV04_10805 [Lachnospiraceae bacterium]|nr:hypothetical protein [Lachnospiraceae bacterium]
MKKRLWMIPLLGAAIVGIVGCAMSQSHSEDPTTEKADEAGEEGEEAAGQEKEASGEENEAGENTSEAETETAKEEVNEEGISEGNRSGTEKEEALSEEVPIGEEIENFVTYYGCPNSRRVAALNVRKNRMRI